MPIQDEIYIFGETLDISIYLRQAGSAFEYDGFLQSRLEQALQHPAHPEVFFYGSRHNIQFRGGLVDDFQSLVERTLYEFIHDIRQV